jgi:hypothetical protein
LLTAAVFATTFIAAPAIRADDAGLSPTATAAFNDLAACMQKPKSQLNVLYVLDASSSLQEDTDPQRLRGKILAQAIRQLGGLSAERDVYFAVSSFDIGYAVRKPWTQLTPETTEQAAAWPEQQYGWWGTGGGTDWLDALSGGLETMQQSPNVEDACKLMVWVTDGGINASPSGDKLDYATNIAAMEQLCGTDPVTSQKADSGGVPVVDSIRSSGIHLVAVALASEDYLGTLSGDELADEVSKFSYLIPVSEGSGVVSNAGLTGGAAEEFTYNCGTNPLPEGWAAGAFVPGESPIALAFQFAGVVDRIRGGQPLPDVKLPGTFEVEPGINRVTIQLAGSEWSITGPDGDIVVSSTQPGKPSVQVTAQGELVSIQIDEPLLKVGTWRIDVTDPAAPARVFVYALIDGNADIPQLRVGEQANIVVSITSEITQQAVLQADYAPAAITVTAGAPGANPETLNCTQDPSLLVFTCPITPTAVGTVRIKARLDLESKNGTRLKQFNGTFDEQVAPQASYPQVVPDQITLSALDGRRGKATGEITIKGPEEGDGQVCLPATDAITITQDVVDRATSYVFGGPSWGQCIDIDQGETATVQFDVSNEVPASGSVVGAFTVDLKSDQTDAVVTQQVNFEFTSIRQGTPPAWLLIALLLLGLAIPIALLYLQARSSSKLVMRGLQMASVPVTLTFEGGYVTLARETPAGGQLITLQDWNWISSSGSRRSFAAPGGVTLRAITPRNPLGPITARAQGNNNTRVASVRGTGQSGAWAPIDLNPAGEWFISVPVDSLVDESKTAVAGTLVAFVNPGMGDLGERSMEMTTEIQSQFQSQVWDEIRSASRGQAAKSRRTKPKPDKPGKPNGGSWGTPPLPPPEGDVWGPPSPSAPTGGSTAPPMPPPPTTPPPSTPPSGPSIPGADDLWKL